MRGAAPPSAGWCSSSGCWCPPWTRSPHHHDDADDNDDNDDSDDNDDDDDGDGCCGDDDDDHDDGHDHEKSVSV